MASPLQLHFLTLVYQAAKQAPHIFPGAAAAEAAVESRWGLSQLAAKDFNLFGQKQQVHPIYGTIHLPTKEFLNHEWVTVDAAWILFPNWAASFQSRMDTLCRMAPTYPHYQAALKATTAEDYVTEVSKSWSTGPDRAKEVLEIYHSHLDILKG